MKIIIAGLAALALLYAPGAQADSLDDAYLQAVGVSAYPPERLISLGHFVCQNRAINAQPGPITAALMLTNPGMSPGDAGAITSAAMQVYCP